MHLLQIDDNRGDVTLVRAALKDVATPVRLTVVQDGHAAKAPALHPVNTILVTAGKGSLPAVVIHEVKEAKLDERWSFVGGKKQARWLWEALDPQTGRIVAYTFGRRADRALLKLKTLRAPLGIRRFFTDGRGAYRRHLDPHRPVSLANEERNSWSGNISPCVRGSNAW